MLDIRGYSLRSFTVGAKHERTFSVDTLRGTIADYVLGECGASESPIPEDFYDQVAYADGGGVRLSKRDAPQHFTCTRDRVIVTDSTSEIGQSLAHLSPMLERARHLILGTLQFLDTPNGIFLGFVFEYAETEKKTRERFKHPIAESLSKNLTTLPFTQFDYPAEARVRVAFRRRVAESILRKGLDDYINVILDIQDAPISELWPNAMTPKTDTATEDIRLGTISLDVQVVLDPRRQLTPAMFETHHQLYDSDLRSRLATLLAGVGFVSPE